MYEAHGARRDKLLNMLHRVLCWRKCPPKPPAHHDPATIGGRCRCACPGLWVRQLLVYRIAWPAKSRQTGHVPLSTHCHPPQGRAMSYTKHLRFVVVGCFWSLRFIVLVSQVDRGRGRGRGRKEVRIIYRSPVEIISRTFRSYIDEPVANYQPTTSAVNR